MKFDELESRFRALETQNEERLNFDGPLVARLDGRGFTRLTKRSLDLEKPFDIRFHDAMKTSVAHLCECGFAVRLAYSQSDEISLLFESTERSFDGKARKWLSVLAGEASGAFSLAMKQLGAFDCRLIELPGEDWAVDYFRWRQSDAFRNALSAHCYWILRNQNLSARAATSHQNGWTISQKREFLREQNVGIEALPRWQTRGFAAHFVSFEKIGFDPKTQSEVRALRKRLEFNTELPDGDEFGLWLREQIQAT